MQYRYRMRSIKKIYWKEFLWTFVTMLILVIINFKYILNFNMTIPKQY